MQLHALAFLALPLAAQEPAKPPAIPDAVQAQYRASELKVQEANVALKLARAEADLIAAQKSQMDAIKAVTAACGEFVPQLAGGQLVCVPKPTETAAAKPGAMTGTDRRASAKGTSAATAPDVRKKEKP